MLMFLLNSIRLTSNKHLHLRIMKKIAKPQPGSYPEYYEQYLKLIPADANVLDLFTTSNMDTIDLYTSVDGETLMFRYAEGKWNMLEILQHLMDTERILSYRALRIARGDKEDNPGFDENKFAANSFAADRNMMDMVREFSILRASTIELFKSLTDEALQQRGMANGFVVTPAALAAIIVAHEIHHLKVIDERYLPK
jgi:hypothetical protein